jgi:Putative capsular polysaccharide synthesis protein
MLDFINRLTKRKSFQAHIDPIIIYQPGKVGSSTILASLNHSLQSAATETAIYHAHHLNNLEQMEADIKSKFPNPQKSLEKLEIDKELRRRIDENPSQRWNVISLTREPVARTISTVFEMLDVIFPGWKAKYQAGEWDLYEMQDIIVKRYVSGPGGGDWYDTQMKAVFDIDVYAQPFPHSQGYEIYYGKNNSRLLLLRLEDLNRVGQKVLSDFLNLKEFHLVQSNVGEQKEYSDLYREFKKIPLPASYLEKMYASRYAKQFYTDEEIHSFYQKWIAGQG